MASSELLLIKPVDGLGGEGDQVKVRAGYARNFLLPRGYAVPLTQSNKKQVEALKKRRGEREAQELAGAQELAKQLEKVSIAFVVKTGEGGKMFGAITVNDLHDKLVASGKVDTHKVKVFATTPTYFDYNWTVRGTLDPVLVAKIKAAFLALDPANPEHKAILDLQAASRFIETKPENYQSIEDAARAADLLK